MRTNARRSEAGRVGEKGGSEGGRRVCITGEKLHAQAPRSLSGRRAGWGRTTSRAVPSVGDSVGHRRRTAGWALDVGGVARPAFYALTYRCGRCHGKRGGELRAKRGAGASRCGRRSGVGVKSQTQSGNTPGAEGERGRRAAILQQNDRHGHDGRRQRRPRRGVVDGVISRGQPATLPGRFS